jgi:hypothetical protein
MDPLASHRISACKKGKESHLQSFSWPSTERYNPDEMHARTQRTKQRLGPVGMNPSRLRTSSDHSTRVVGTALDFRRDAHGFDI